MLHRCYCWTKCQIVCRQPWEWSFCQHWSLQFVNSNSLLSNEMIWYGALSSEKLSVCIWKDSPAFILFISTANMPTMCYMSFMCDLFCHFFATAFGCCLIGSFLWSLCAQASAAFCRKWDRKWLVAYELLGEVAHKLIFVGFLTSNQLSVAVLSWLLDQRPGMPCPRM